MFKPKFRITNTLLTKVAKIDAAQEIIVNAPLIPAWERKFQEEAVLRSVHHSTKIEGNELSMGEVEKVLMGGKVQTRRIRDVQEVINYRNVVKYIGENFVDKKKDVWEDTLFTIHKMLTENIIPDFWRGRYRDKKAYEVDVGSGNIVAEMVAPEEIEKRVKELFLWYNGKKGKELHPIIRAGILHYQITYIHPFVEANGRTARAMATLSLCNDGYDIRRFFCLDEYYDQDVERYYYFLKITDETQDMTKWLEYFADGLREELEKIKTKVIELSRDTAFKNKIGGQIALSERQIKILKFIQKNGAFYNKDFKKIFPDLSDDTVLRELKLLLEKKLIRKEGKTKGAKYVLG